MDPSTRSETGRISIVLADDHTVMRNGLRMLLDAEGQFDVVAEAGTIQSVFREVRSHRPDVLVLDLNMPGGSSVEAIPKLAVLSPRMAVVVLTMEPDSVFKHEAYDAGASGYVLKEAAATELVKAIRQAWARAPSRSRGPGGSVETPDRGSGP